MADLQEEVKAQATKVAELLENYEKMSRQATEVMEEQAEWNEERKSLRQKMEDLSEEAEVGSFYTVDPRLCDNSRVGNIFSPGRW